MLNLHAFFFFRPPLTWGNQESMRPLSKTALNATASQRVCELATPKKNFQLENPQKCSRYDLSFELNKQTIFSNALCCDRLSLRFSYSIFLIQNYL